MLGSYVRSSEIGIPERPRTCRPAHSRHWVATEGMEMATLDVPEAGPHPSADQPGRCGHHRYVPL
jgi:hypothetical protein